MSVENQDSLSTATLELHEAGRPGRTTALVLEAVRSPIPLAPVLLTGDACSIGSDPTCTICLPVEGVRPQHGVIVHSSLGLVFRVSDPDAWLNEGLNESPLRDGDRLVIGEVEFGVRTATTYELAGSGMHRALNGSHRSSDDFSSGDSADIRSDLAELERQLDDRESDLKNREAAARQRADEVHRRLWALEQSLTELEAREQRLAARRAELERREAELHEREHALSARAGEPGPSADAAAETASSGRSGDSTADLGRFQRLFARPSPAPEASSDPSAPEPAATVSSAGDETLEISITDYMNQLLARTRGPRSAGTWTPAAHAPIEAAAPTAHNRPATALHLHAATPESHPPTPRAPAEPLKPRPLPNRDAIRAGMQTMRLVANQSARHAVAKHSRKRVRFAVSLKLLLGMLAFALACGMVYGLRDGSVHPQFVWAAAIIGVITVIDMLGHVTKLVDPHECPRNPGANPPPMEG